MARRNPTLKTKQEGTREFRFMTLDEGKMLRPGERIWFVANDRLARQVTVNGRPKTWKRDPFRLEVPVKYGLYEYDTFTSANFAGGSNPRVLVLV